MSEICDNMEKEYEIEDVEKNYNNKDFMLEAINNNATWVLAYASDRLHADKKLMLEAARKDGQVLYYASQELRDDYELVLTAVKNKWLIVKYASKRLRGNKDIALAVLQQNKDAYIYLTNEVLSEPEIKAIMEKE